MQFTGRKRRHPPAVIIIALIDVLIVVLIFLIVTTTFRQHPAVNLALPQVRQADATGMVDRALIVTIPKDGPIYLQDRPVTMDTLQRALVEAVHQNPEVHLLINADEAASVGQVFRVRDTAMAAKVGAVHILGQEDFRP